MTIASTRDPRRMLEARPAFLLEVGDEVAGVGDAAWEEWERYEWRRPHRVVEHKVRRRDGRAPVVVVEFDHGTKSFVPCDYPYLVEVTP